MHSELRNWGTEPYIKTETENLVVGMKVSNLTWADDAPVLTIDDTEAFDVPPPKGMVLIPTGEFQMSSIDAQARRDAQPVGTVFVNTFYVDETEVTNMLSLLRQKKNLNRK